MSETPDLSKIVSVIMQNPALISEIAALASATKQPTEQPTEETKPEVVIEQSKQTSPIPERPEPSRARAHRKELLSAMKPYLSESRRGALDSMASILDVIDVMIRKES